MRRQVLLSVKLMIKLGIEADIPPDLLKLARRVRRWILRQGEGFAAGWCGTAAERLCELDNRLKCCSGHCFDEAHSWAEFGSYILDVTADQFNGERVHFAPIVFGTNTQLHTLYERDKIWTL